MRGTVVSHYRVLEQIGQGGMGVVYLAEDEKLARKVALKFISPSIAADPTARARLLREARVASALDHPNIATVYEVGEWNGELFLALAYYAGETLSDRIARGPLSVVEATAIGVQIAQGLAAAHAASVVHRDLKPANVIITPSGVAKILDFGLARSAGPLAETAVDLTVAGSVTGTLAYMAPEQAHGAYADPRADIWAIDISDSLASQDARLGVQSVIRDPFADWINIRTKDPACHRFADDRYVWGLIVIVLRELPSGF